MIESESSLWYTVILNNNCRDNWIGLLGSIKKVHENLNSVSSNSIVLTEIYFELG